MDFRLGFGASFGEETRDRRARPRRARARPPAAGRGRALRRHRRDARRARDGAGGRTRRALGRAAARRSRPRSARPRPRELADGRAPLHPMRALQASSARCSTATRSSSATAATSSPTPGASSTPTSRAAGWTRGRTAAWAAGPATRWRRSSRSPTSQVVLLLGDGAFGFSGMEFDTLARHGVNVVGVMGNNGIWALEKHPMEFLYGYSRGRRPAPGHALRPDRRGARLPRRARRAARRLRPALAARVRVGQAGAGQRPHGPDVVYPRKSNLA